MAGLAAKFLTAKEEPHPQADSLCGLLTIANELRINSCSKSTVAPFINSKLPGSETTFTPFFSKILDISKFIYRIQYKSSGEDSSLSIAKLYLNPEHPPPSTVIRNFKCELLVSF